MNVERTVADWLHAEAPARAGDELLNETLARVAGVRQERVLWRRTLPQAAPTTSRPLVVLFAALIALSLVGFAVIGGLNRAIVPPVPPDPSSSPAADASPAPAAAAARNGWVAFAVGSPSLGQPDEEVYLVREGQATPRIVGSESDDLTGSCPAFSPDGTRLAYGQTELTEGPGYTNATLVIADLDEEGNVSNPVEFVVGTGFVPPCAIWSGDSRMLAFFVRHNDPEDLVSPADDTAIWIVRLEDRNITVIPNVSALDMDWAPDGSMIAVVSDFSDNGLPGDPITLYSALGVELETLPNTGGVRALSWSPDGSRIAYQRGPADLGGSSVPSPDYLATLEVRDLTTGDEHVVASGYKVSHGIGPVWSPNGDKIAYQRLCASRPDAPPSRPPALSPCREQHEVVVLSASPGSTWQAPDVTELVLPAVSIPTGGSWWYPYRVTWSPDGESLLYLAWSWEVNPDAVAEARALIVVPTSTDLPPAILIESDQLSDHTWGREPASD